MKQIFLWAFCILALILGAIALGMNLNILPSPPQDNFDEGDSIKIAEIVEQMYSPKMYHVNDVVDLQRQMMLETTTDEVFLSLPSDVLSNITSVLLQTEGYATKEMIVEEYRANDRIYNNLPVDTTLHAPVTSDKDSILQSTDLGSRQKNTLFESTQRSTDTVDGKAVKVVTKTHKYYE